MPSINSARYTQRIIQTVKSRKSTVSEKVHRLDPPLCRHDMMMMIHSHEDREGGREGCQRIFVVVHVLNH